MYYAVAGLGAEVSAEPAGAALAVWRARAASICALVRRLRTLTGFDLAAAVLATASLRSFMVARMIPKTTLAVARGAVTKYLAIFASMLLLGRGIWVLTKYGR